MTILIKNGRVINPATGMDEVADVLVENGVVSKIQKNIDTKAERKVDAKGCYVMPGFIDMHVHLRDPGFEQKRPLKRAAGRLPTADLRQSLRCRIRNRWLTIQML